MTWLDVDGRAVPDPATGPANAAQRGQRTETERLVLTILHSHGPLAKAPVARMTGLSAQTVSVIMRRLEAESLIVREDPVRGRIGQPSVPMRLNPAGAGFLGLKIGRRSMELVLIDFRGGIVDRQWMTHAYPQPDAALRFATDATAEILNGISAEARARIAGIGIAMPFRMWNWAAHLGVPDAEMAAWRDRDIATEIGTALRIPTYLRNDATAACGAELVFGDGANPADFLHVYVGYFIGGGLVLGGRLQTGPNGNSTALGPMPVPAAGGGTTPLIQLASLRGLEHRLAAAGLSADRLWQSPEGWDIPPALLDDWIGEAGRGLAHAAAATAAIVEIDAVLIDGWLPAGIRAALVDSVRGALGRFDLSGITPPRIAPGSIGPEARALGAASLPLSAQFLLDGGVPAP